MMFIRLSEMVVEISPLRVADDTAQLARFDCTRRRGRRPR